MLIRTGRKVLSNFPYDVSAWIMLHSLIVVEVFQAWKSGGGGGWSSSCYGTKEISLVCYCKYMDDNSKITTYLWKIF